REIRAPRLHWSVRAAAGARRRVSLPQQTDPKRPRSTPFSPSDLCVWVGSVQASAGLALLLLGRLPAAPTPPPDRAPDREHDDRPDDRADDPARPDVQAVAGDEAREEPTDERPHDPRDERLRPVRLPAQDELGDPAHGHAEHDDEQ